MKVIFGGTFDPVHNGHLRMAIELAETLGGRQVHLLPCYQAVHKQGVGASPEQRLKMLHLATHDDALLAVDEREIRRETASYTIDTLRELRAQCTDETLVLAVGSDAAADMPRWREFSEFAALCHVVVMCRPGFHDAGVFGALEAYGFEQLQSVDALHSIKAGGLLDLRLNLLEISSSDIRTRIAQGKSVRYLVEGAVREFICDNGLYQPKQEGK